LKPAIRREPGNGIEVVPCRDPKRRRGPGEVESHQIVARLGPVGIMRLAHRDRPVVPDDHVGKAHPGRDTRFGRDRFGLALGIDPVQALVGEPGGKDHPVADGVGAPSVLVDPGAGVEVIGSDVVDGSGR